MCIPGINPVCSVYKLPDSDVNIFIKTFVFICRTGFPIILPYTIEFLYQDLLGSLNELGNKPIFLFSGRICIMLKTFLPWMFGGNYQWSQLEFCLYKNF